MKSMQTAFDKNPYKPKNLCVEADICVNCCPQPETDCKGHLCEFYKQEKARRQAKNGNKTK